MHNKDFLAGTCEAMCPSAEVAFRRKHGLVHFFEQKFFVAEYSRSAADKKLKSASEIRTFKALQKTNEYLLNTILLHPDKPFNVRYDFIFDRFRAVRQEVTMQNFSSIKTVKILEPIVMFLSFSIYRLKGSPIAIFDPKICVQHLQECLLKCLSCYEELEADESELPQNSCRMFIEGIYLCLNMDDTSALQRALRLNTKLKSSFIIRSAIEISLNFHTRSFYRVLCDIQTLPHLICAISSLQIPRIRTEMLKIFSIAYNSKACLVPIEFLKKLLVYDDLKTLVEDLRALQVYEGSDECPSHVIFNKTKFDGSKPISNTHHQFVEQKISDYHLPDLLLLKSL